MNHTKLITKLSKFEKQKTSFNLTFRYIDDGLSLNNPKFNDYINVIYPKELEIKDTTDALNGLIILTMEFDEDGKLFTRLVCQVWWFWFLYSQFSILK